MTPEEDPHSGPGTLAMRVDEDGRIHVEGNMHNPPSPPEQSPPEALSETGNVSQAKVSQESFVQRRELDHQPMTLQSWHNAIRTIRSDESGGTDPRVIRHQIAPSQGQIFITYEQLAESDRIAQDAEETTRVWALIDKADKRKGQNLIWLRANGKRE